MSVIKLEAQEWRNIRLRIKEDYKLQPAILLMRTVMRRELGFTTRYHRYWKYDNGHDGYGQYVEEIHLDFYDENAATMFRLRYL